jgi:hypothetical protein
MTYPTFLVIGAMKAGTTTLHAQLDSHPDVFMSRTKELHYFAESKNWRRGPTWYAEQFGDGRGCAARGEASPSYSQADIFPGVPARVASTIPDVKLIYLVRDPIERMQSMYLHQRANGLETRPIDEAFRQETYYLNSSRYGWQLEQYSGHVPPERIKVVRTERLRTDLAALMAELFEFVGVEPSVQVQPIAKGRTDDKRIARPVRQRLGRVPGYRRLTTIAPEPVRRRARRLVTRPLDVESAALSAALRAELTEQLAPDLAVLRRFAGDDFAGWPLGAEPADR